MASRPASAHRGGRRAGAGRGCPPRGRRRCPVRQDVGDQAAFAAFVVGNRHTSDDHGRNWPADVRLLSKGDVLRITAPDGFTTHLAIASSGFATAAPPTEHIHLAATHATSRRAPAGRKVGALAELHVWAGGFHISPGPAPLARLPGPGSLAGSGRPEAGRLARIWIIGHGLASLVATARKPDRFVGGVGLRANGVTRSVRGWATRSASTVEERSNPVRRLRLRAQPPAQKPPP